ncbi:hypothetical protein [Azotobacter armeniacus]
MSLKPSPDQQLSKDLLDVLIQATLIAIWTVNRKACQRKRQAG